MKRCEKDFQEFKEDPEEGPEEGLSSSVDHPVVHSIDAPDEAESMIRNLEQNADPGLRILAWIAFLWLLKQRQ